MKGDPSPLPREEPPRSLQPGRGLSGSVPGQPEQTKTYWKYVDGKQFFLIRVFRSTSTLSIEAPAGVCDKQSAKEGGPAPAQAP